MARKTASSINFSMTQKHAMEAGAAIRNRLVSVAKKAASKEALKAKFPHTYIYSPPGLGKTFTVEKQLEHSGMINHTISGNISMFAFGISLAVIRHTSPTNKPIIIVVDDCDEILKNETNINIMKNILVGHKVYDYQQSMQSQWKSLSPLQQEAIIAHSSPDKLGFTVPTDNFVFVFTSNFKLPTDDDVQAARDKMQAKANKMSHLNAIRSRCRPADFDLTDNEQWGWIADVIMNEDCIDVSHNDKIILLDWMYNNWENMNERSIRTAEKMAECMIEDPTGYRDSWEIDYLK
jgi:hypothetical protein